MILQLRVTCLIQLLGGQLSVELTCLERTVARSICEIHATIQKDSPKFFLITDSRKETSSSSAGSKSFTCIIAITGSAVTTSCEYCTDRNRKVMNTYHWSSRYDSTQLNSLSHRDVHQLNKYDKALSFALGPGTPGNMFQAETRTYSSEEVVKTIVSKAIDHYIQARSVEQSSSKEKIDPACSLQLKVFGTPDFLYHIGIKSESYASFLLFP